ncbi:hypothetical protein J7J13_02960 [bacterium]|nr:hypothetical protein [bacterium]
MSFEVTTAFVQQYKANVQLLSQQRGTRFRGTVREEPQTGKNAFYDQIGATTARKRTERHGDTPLISTPHSRRRVSLVDYDWADLIDDMDKIRMLIDPQSAYALNASYAMGRAMDEEIINAFTCTAYTGEEGSIPVPFPSSQIIDLSGTITVASLLQVKEMLDAAEVDEGIPRYFTCSANVLSDLLVITDIKSSDYNTVKALVKGEIDTYLGFKFIRSEKLPLDRTTTGGGSGDRSCFAWAQDGILMAVGQNPVGKIDKRPDKNYSTQVFYSQSLGATRMEEVKVVELLCQED